MKVLIINGSPRTDGNTACAIGELEKTFAKNGIETVTVQIGTQPVSGCIACMKCKTTGKCVFVDVVNQIAEIFEGCDGLVVASPVYYASANGTLISLLDRLFYSSGFDKTMKVGASVAIARRGGCSATFDQLNKYFTISGMPVASSQYWNSVHGRAPGEAMEDGEGMRIGDSVRIEYRAMVRRWKENGALIAKQIAAFDAYYKVYTALSDK